MGGVIVPPADYWPAVRKLLDKWGILMIADEVVTAFGRSGCMLGSRGWGVKPDILCLAKGISAGYIPLGAQLLEKLQVLPPKYASVGEVRGKGLMIAIDLVQNKATRQPVDPSRGYANRVAEYAKSAGVLVRPVGTRIILSPPLTVTGDEADHIAEALDKAFAAAG